MMRCRSSSRCSTIVIVPVRRSSERFLRGMTLMIEPIPDYSA